MTVILGGRKKKGGVFVSGAVKVADLEKQMLNRINQDDLLEVDKVKRYIGIVRQIRKLQTEINKAGVLTTTVNASQEFIRTNPAINELNKLTKTLISLENSIKFEKMEVTEIPKKDNDEPEVSDLY
jgi:hypothetical protein